MGKRKIVIEVEVPDGSEVGSLEAAEDVAFGVARQAFGQTLQELANGRQQDAGACPQCGEESAVRLGRRERELYTRMGEVRLSRQRCRCGACGHVFFPSAGELGSA